MEEIKSITTCAKQKIIFNNNYYYASFIKDIVILTDQVIRYIIMMPLE